MQILEGGAKKTSISLTPLIDVIFILLVFFMLASSFLEWQYLELGVSESKNIQVDLAKQSLIRVEPGQRYLLNEKELSLAEITGRVRERLRRDPDHAVLVQPVDDLPLQGLVHVLNELKKVGGDNVSLTRVNEAP